MKAKGYIRHFVKMLQEDGLDPKTASINILDMLWMETKLMADKNKVFLEADFTELIMQQNAKWRVFGGKMDLDKDGFIFYIMQRNPKLWKRLKGQKRFADVAERVTKKLENIEFQHNLRKRKAEGNGNQPEG